MNKLDKLLEYAAHMTKYDRDFFESIRKELLKQEKHYEGFVAEQIVSAIDQQKDLILELLYKIKNNE